LHHQLLLMRHAKSDWNAGSGTDFDRPLSKRGIREAGKIAKWLSEQGFVPDLFVCSPAKRTSDTAEIVAQQLGVKSDTIIRELELYEAVVEDILAVIARYSKNHRSILLIGHNPGLDNLLGYLASEAPPRTLSGKLMTTSAVALLDFGSRPVSTQPHSASLMQLVRPKELP